MQQQLDQDHVTAAEYLKTNNSLTTGAVHEVEVNNNSWTKNADTKEIEVSWLSNQDTDQEGRTLKWDITKWDSTECLLHKV